ncbi:Substance-K receptor [Trichoplax sp. H2]|nr:Substance-K receptor [Trichoplax sp. H2]|eukprot:RDD38357.1 Substance-K receptor [Trichoplax sp. H2]
MNNSINDFVNNSQAIINNISGYIERIEVIRTALTIIAVIYVTLILIGIPGNLLIIWITLANKHLRIPINLLVCNLALAGLLIASLRIPITIFELLFPIQFANHYPFTLSVCRLSEIVPGACVITISLTLMAICIDRYHSIVHPTKYKLRMNPVKAIIFLILCWLFAFSFWIPYAFFIRIGSSTRYRYCYTIWPSSPLLDVRIPNSAYGNIIIPYSKMIYLPLYFILIFLIPITIMTTLYIITAKKLWHTRPEHMLTTALNSTKPNATTSKRSDNISQDGHRLHARKRIVRIFIACFILFIFSNLPYYMITILIQFGLIPVWSGNSEFVLYRVFILLNYSCVAYNAIIYGYFNYNFRRKAPRWLQYKCPQCRSARLSAK